MCSALFFFFFFFSLLKCLIWNQMYYTVGLLLQFDINRFPHTWLQTEISECVISQTTCTSSPFPRKPLGDKTQSASSVSRQTPVYKLRWKDCLSAPNRNKQVKEHDYTTHPLILLLVSAPSPSFLRALSPSFIGESSKSPVKHDPGMIGAASEASKNLFFEVTSRINLRQTNTKLQSE